MAERSSGKVRTQPAALSLRLRKRDERASIQCVFFYAIKRRTLQHRETYQVDVTIHRSHIQF